MSHNDIEKVTIDDLLTKAGNYFSEDNLLELEKTCKFASEVYGCHQLSSKEQNIDRQLAVASILTGMRLDLEGLQGALLGRVLFSDFGVSRKELSKKFGQEVLNIIIEIERINGLRLNTSRSMQPEKIRKMLIAMSSDIRILLISLAERLHDIRIMDLPNRQKKKFAGETMELYAPLANRLGIDWMKRELEDRAFAYLHPETYQKLADQVESAVVDRQTYVKKVENILTELLGDHGITDFEILGRPKHLWSIYRKLVAQNIPIEKVYDKVAFRIIVQTIPQCYETLGLIHNLWTPIAGRFKDFINAPKSNMYQSLHTSVIGPFSNFMEIQIRTREMDKIAQEGLAAHWAYKEERSISPRDAKLFQSLKQLISSLQEVENPRELLNAIKYELATTNIYTLTPDGDIKEFPQGSTILDFAYAVHSEVGNTCTGARVNSLIAPLKTELHNGDVVEILTSAKQHPRRGWLKMVKTSRAKNRIRHWLRQDELERHIKKGREICEKKLRQYNLSLKKIIKTGHLKEILKRAKSPNLNDLLAKVGSGKLSAGRLEEIMLPREIEKEKEEQVIRKTRTVRKTSSGENIEIDGINDMLINIGRCCKPIPGDDIIGFITMGRGVTVHKRSCPNLQRYDESRLIQVNWSPTGKETPYMAHVQITAQDKKGLLVNLCNSISANNADIRNVEARTMKNNLAKLDFKLEVNTLDHLSVILQHLRGINGVIEARRK
ncbi:MAG: RelA/SpoT family protein [Thermodesulfobacteriota bacterium]